MSIQGSHDRIFKNSAHTLPKGRVVTLKSCRRLLTTSRTCSVVRNSLGFAGSPDAQQSVAATIRRKVAIFVEPSPFSHVSGMKNRFECLIQGLRGSLLQLRDEVFNCHTFSFIAELGDDVTVVTPDVNPPKHYFGARVSVE